MAEAEGTPCFFLLFSSFFVASGGGRGTSWAPCRGRTKLRNVDRWWPDKTPEGDLRDAVAGAGTSPGASPPLVTSPRCRCRVPAFQPTLSSHRRPSLTFAACQSPVIKHCQYSCPPQAKKNNPPRPNKTRPPQKSCPIAVMPPKSHGGCPLAVLRCSAGSCPFHEGTTSAHLLACPVSTNSRAPIVGSARLILRFAQTP
jgi:hypothetical protein